MNISLLSLQQKSILIATKRWIVILREIMTIVTSLGIAKDIILTLAAIAGSTTAVIGSYVAVKGLNTWKRQIGGQSDHNLSKNLLISIFKYRDAINSLRRPFMSSHEMPQPTQEESEKMSVDELLHYGRFKAYQAR